MQNPENDLLFRQLDELLPTVSVLTCRPSLSSNARLCVQTVLPMLQLLRKSVSEQGMPEDIAQVPSSKLPAGFLEGQHKNARLQLPMRLISGASPDPRSPSSPRLTQIDNSRASSGFSCQTSPALSPAPSPSSQSHSPANINISKSIRTCKFVPRDAPDVGTQNGFIPELDSYEPPSNVSVGTVWKCQPCYIHPNRPGRLAWDFCTMAFIMVLILVIPFELTFLWDVESNPTTNNAALWWINCFADFWFGVDIVLNCFTAVHAGKGGDLRLIKQPSQIIKTYASGWLWMDLLATFPVDRIAELAGAGSGTNGQAIGMLRVLRVAKAARMLKVLRVLKLGGLVQIMEEHIVLVQSMTVAFQLAKLSIVMVLITHGTACIWFAIGNFCGDGYATTWVKVQGIENVSAIDQWVASFYFAITTGTTVGYGDISATNTLEQVVGSLLLLAAVAYIGQFLARVGQVVSTLQQGEADKMKVKRDAMVFMKRRNVAKDTYQNVLRYIDHVYETDSVTSFTQTGFLEKLSESLQLELRLQVTGNLLKRLPIFAGAGDAFVKAICASCRTVRAGQGDVVAQQAQMNEDMYMIVLGEVMIAKNNEKLGILHDEDWFGERALFIDGLRHNVSVRCETDCEFLVLARPDFVNQVARFPKVQSEYDTIVKTLCSVNSAGIPGIRPLGRRKFGSAHASRFG